MRTATDPTATSTGHERPPALLTAVGQGFRRARLEGGHLLRNGQDLLGNGIWLAGMLAPLLFLRDDLLPDSSLTVAAFILPSIVSMALAFYGIFSLAQQLVGERQDGTLLRLKALPHGMVSYLIGKIVFISVIVLLVVTVVITVAVLALEDVQADPGMAATLSWVLPLSLLAVLPAGAVLGSVVSSPRNMNLVMLPLAGLAAISGIFFPITVMPEPLQVLAQLFPLYWIALAARSALLPDSAVVAEIGESWRHLETLGVLGAWAVVGLVVAPAVLRRVARRESGSSMRTRRDRAMAGAE